MKTTEVYMSTVALIILAVVMNLSINGTGDKESNREASKEVKEQSK